MSVHTTVMKHIEATPVGVPFLTKSLLSFGSRSAIDQALTRLVKAGKVDRVARGIYARLKYSRVLGRPIMPSAKAVVEAIAKAEHATVEVHGAEAARRLELSTQVPSQKIFLSTGSPHSFKLGELKVTIKQVPSKRLYLAGRPAGLALLALLYLGNAGVTTEVLKKIESKIGQAELQMLREQSQVMPGWLNDSLIRYGQGQPELAA